MLVAARLVIRGALARTESRGTHRRRDHPTTDDRQRIRYVWTRGDSAPTIRPASSTPHEPRSDSVEVSS